MDSDDWFTEEEELRWESMRSNGITEEEITRAKRFKQCRNDVSLYSQIVKTQAWESDISCDFVKSHLKLSAALDGINQRAEAIELLENVLSLNEELEEETDSRLVLALAKLLFRADFKDRSLQLCGKIFQQFELQQKAENTENTDVLVSLEDVCDAYYLGGWVKIHDDDHTTAYKIWQQGYDAVQSFQARRRQIRTADRGGRAAGPPLDYLTPAEMAGVELLRIQCSKRAVWDLTWQECVESKAEETAGAFVGSIPPPSLPPPFSLHLPPLASTTTTSTTATKFETSYESYLHACGLEGFKVAPNSTAAAAAAVASITTGSISSNYSSSSSSSSPHHMCPALSIFGPQQQHLGVVFRSRVPLLSHEECQNVLNCVNTFISKERGDVWSTVRCSSVKTTDVAVEDILPLRNWLLVLMHTRISPLIAVAFPVLADGSSTISTCTTSTSSTTTTTIETDSSSSSNINCNSNSSSSCNSNCNRNSRVRIHDAFIVRYDADVDMSTYLPEHCDTSSMSVIISLNIAEEDEEEAAEEADQDEEENEEEEIVIERIEDVQERKNLCATEERKREFLSCSGIRNTSDDDDDDHIVNDSSTTRNSASSSSSATSIKKPEQSKKRVKVKVKKMTGGGYKGGGTWFEALGADGIGKVVNASEGHAVLFAGPLKHAGFPISRGVRHILVLFLYIEDFHYGPYLQVAKRSAEIAAANVITVNSDDDDDDAQNNNNNRATSAKSASSSSSNEVITGGPEAVLLSSGGHKGGFVVYRQTVDLVTMLEKTSLSDDDDDNDE